LQGGKHVILSNNVMLAGHVTVGDFVIFGGGAAVIQFARVGSHAFVGGLSGLENDLIPYGLAMGNRAHLAGLNLVGLRRRGFSREAIHDLRRAYRLLFAQEGTLKERVEDVAAEFSDHPQVHEILDFIRDGGERAICTPRGGGLGRVSHAPDRPSERPLDVFVVAGEESGDQLGYKLMRALREASGGCVTFRGVGGKAMEGEGLQSLFPMSDVAVMGFLPVIKRLPQLLARIRETADAIVAAPPDVLVIIDSPDLTHRVARRARARCRSFPWSTTSAPRCGRGGRGARRRCAPMSITCSRCCRSSRPRTSALAGRPAPMSAIRSSSVWRTCARTRPRPPRARARRAPRCLFFPARAAARSSACRTISAARWPA
jgi:hypothetical protein